MSGGLGIITAGVTPLNELPQTGAVLTFLEHRSHQACISSG